MDGIEITSRYQKAHEYELMVKMVEEVPKPLRYVKSIFCDSKATYCFSVKAMGQKHCWYYWP
jgi:hypothetical protein